MAVAGGGGSEEFKKRLDALLAASGGKLRVGSGTRSNAHQTELWQAALKKYGSAKAARKWVAPPGTSMHEFGLAADLKGDLGWAHKNADKHGLYFPMSWEPWHIQGQGLGKGGGLASATTKAAYSIPIAQIPEVIRALDEEALKQKSIEKQTAYTGIRSNLMQAYQSHVQSQQSDRLASLDAWQYQSVEPRLFKAQQQLELLGATPRQRAMLALTSKASLLRYNAERGLNEAWGGLQDATKSGMPFAVLGAAMKYESALTGKTGADKEALELELRARRLADKFALMDEKLGLVNEQLGTLAERDFEKTIENALGAGTTFKTRMESFQEKFGNQRDDLRHQVQLAIVNQKISDRAKSPALYESRMEEGYYQILEGQLYRQGLSGLGKSLDSGAIKRMMFSDAKQSAIASLLLGFAASPTTFGQANIASAFSPFMEYGAQRKNFLINQALVGPDRSKYETNYGKGIIDFDRKGYNAARREMHQQAGATLLGDIVGSYLGQAVGGDPAAVSLGGSIGSGIALLANANPYIAAGASILGSLLGGLFGKKKKDPADREHKKRIEELLNRIDRSLRPQADYFRTIKGEALFGSASRWYSGRAYGFLGMQRSRGFV
jgi:hypothetical protein